MRLNEFSNSVEFKIKDYPDRGFSVLVFSDMKINRKKMPKLYQTLMKAKQIGFLDIGFGVESNPKKYMAIETVFLAKEATGQGLGKLLYTKALEHAKEKYGVKGLSSHYQDRNMNSNKFWAKHTQGERNGYDVRHDPFEGLE